jgi:hypothetical protein
MTIAATVNIVATSESGRVTPINLIPPGANEIPSVL